ncbi:hypothetical protein [Candidatus Vidania fulgoroideorum]
MKNLLNIKNLNFNEYKKIFKIAKAYKKKYFSKDFLNKTMIMLFEKPSTRTRVSLEKSFISGEGKVIFLNKSDTQISRGESLKDTVKTLENFCDILIIRTFSEKKIENVVKFSKVPIINALTNNSHPLQVISDIFTFSEKKSIKDSKIIWVGEKNNVFKTWIDASKIFNFKIKNILNINKLKNKIKKCDFLITDTWCSMGKKKFKNGLTIKKKHLDKLGKNSFFTHCLPAYRGQEVSSGVINHKKSLVWKAIKDKLYVYKAIINYILKSCET